MKKIMNNGAKSNMKNGIPSKLYYSISEVARITEIKAHVLRYWEGEFPTLRVKKSRTGSRRYRQIDIEEILAIKELLYKEGFKIAGARKIRRQSRLESHEVEVAPAKQMTMGFGEMNHSEQLSFVSKELEELLQMIRAMHIPQPEAQVSAGAKGKPKSPLQKMEGTA